MSFYLYIAAQQSPFNIGVDGNQREQFSVNFLAKIRNTTSTFEQEMAQRLQAQSVGTRNTDMFIGLLVALPTGDGPYIRIISTAGLATITTHNDNSYASYGLQVIVSDADYAMAQSKSNDVHNALHGLANITLAPS